VSDRTKSKKLANTSQHFRALF